MENGKKRVICGILAPCVWILCGVIAGVLTGNRVPFPPMILIIIGVIASVPLLMAALGYGASSGRKRARVLALSVVIAVCGFFVGTFALGQTMNFIVLRHMGQ